MDERQKKELSIEDWKERLSQSEERSHNLKKKVRKLKRRLKGEESYYETKRRKLKKKLHRCKQKLEAEREYRYELECKIIKMRYEANLMEKEQQYEKSILQVKQENQESISQMEKRHQCEMFELENKYQTGLHELQHEVTRTQMQNEFTKWLCDIFMKEMLPEFSRKYGKKQPVIDVDYRICENLDQSLSN